LKLSRGSVRNVIDAYEDALAEGDWDVEAAALLGNFDPSSMHVEGIGCSSDDCEGPHPVTADDITEMDHPQLFRLWHSTPLEHPCRRLYEAARAQGWAHVWADGSLDAGVARLVR
jgi:hypothetical protein